ncbi:TRAP transporter substrate-binding protein [Gracilibacillus alcaliphilus]|uniref:TRAP transporter substrate-binding protein n=1 Tax=Gracilibacillus alcaliphilus TaxID=1401441 RepID=UPI00195AE583|nr:TRAP transporter substrate-binding protein [Gracilibacillus alcaliphilus]MBM7677875.1 tripartite ATP-independent transporter DctP family solute receptor [Gracilibacillus alcaliphilus]
MKKRALSLWGLMFIAMIMLAGCSEYAVGSDGKTTLILAENQPSDYPTTIGAREFARLVEEKTDGRYEIKVYHGGQLGDEKSVVELMQLGAIDVARVNTTPLTEFNDEIGVLAMPFLFEDEETKWEKLTGEEGDDLLDTFAGSRLVGLAFYDSGERSFYNTIRPIETPEDMRGLKIRVQSSELAIDIVESLGASATPMDYGEVYSSLQNGVIDGAENNFPSYYTSSHYNVASYFTVNGFQGAPEVLLASENLWEALSEEDRIAFKEAAMESIEVQREAWDELTELSRETVVEAGSELVEIEDIEEWREAVQPVYDKYGDEFSEWIEKFSGD